MSENKNKKPEIVDVSDHTDDDIVEHLIIKKGVPIGDDGEVSVVEEYIETRRYNRQEYINSFREDVGVINMLKKCNAGLLNPATLAASFDLGAPIHDVSDIPTDIGDAMNLVDEAHKLYASLDPALKAGLDFDKFCQTFDQEKFNAYIQSKMPKEEKKEESK